MPRHIARLLKRSHQGFMWGRADGEDAGLNAGGGRLFRMSVLLRRFCSTRKQRENSSWQTLALWCWGVFELAATESQRQWSAQAGTEEGSFSSVGGPWTVSSPPRITHVQASRKVLLRLCRAEGALRQVLLHLPTALWKEDLPIVAPTFLLPLVVLMNRCDLPEVQSASLS